MSNNCTSSGSDNDGWKSNNLAVHFAIAGCTFISLCYIYNVVRLVLLNLKIFQPNNVVASFIRKHQANIGALSATMASILGLVFVFGAKAPWPQPLEAAAIVTVVFAQLSALIWQDHPQIGLSKIMLERIPDVFAVFVATLTMSDTAKLYHDLNPDKDFYPRHHPNHQVYPSYALTGASFLLGIVCEGLISLFRFLNNRHDNRRIYNIKRARIRILPSLFFVSQATVVVYTICYSKTSLPDGCSLYNATKISAFVTLSLGVLYSASMATAAFFEAVEEENNINANAENGGANAPQDRENNRNDSQPDARGFSQEALQRRGEGNDNVMGLQNRSRSQASGSENSIETETSSKDENINSSSILMNDLSRKGIQSWA